MNAAILYRREKPSGKRRLLISLLLVALGTVIVAPAMLWLWLFGTKKASQPYRMALARVQQDQQVIRRLGSPIRDTTWFPTGRISGEGDRRTARFNFTVAGPKGTATVSMMARYLQGRWGLTTVDVTFRDGTRHMVAVDDRHRQSAPRWSAPPRSHQQPTTSPGRSPAVRQAARPAPGDIHIDLSDLPDVGARR